MNINFFRDGVRTFFLRDDRRAYRRIFFAWALDEIVSRGALTRRVRRASAGLLAGLGAYRVDGVFEAYLTNAFFGASSRINRVNYIGTRLLTRVRVRALHINSARRMEG